MPLLKRESECMATINDNDDLKKALRSRLDDYEAPVAEDMWQRIDASLSEKSRMHVIRRRWISSVAAAIIVLAIGSIFFLKSPVSNHSTLVGEKNAQQHDKMHINNKLSDDNTKIMHSKSLTATQNNVGKRILPQRKHANLQAQSIESFEFKIQNNDSEKYDPIANDLVDELWVEGQNDSLVNDNRFSEIEQFFAQNYLTLANNNERKPITLAVNARGSLTSKNQIANQPVTLRNAIANNNIADKKLSSMAQNQAIDEASDNVSQMIHSQPVSVGLTVSKPLTDRLSIESGLVYTYLYSKAQNTSNVYRSKETQHLHYLGVPLNLNYNILSLNRLDVFFSVGGMVEKDVYGKYNYVDLRKQNEINSQSEIKVSERIRQPNAQFSVNAGVGVSYPVWNNLYLYGKIGGGYYFDADNKWSTIYSDEKIILDLNVGLRVGF